MQKNDFRADALCSRKLLQLVNGAHDDNVNEIQLQQAMKELASRRHQLAELSGTGKLQGNIHNN